MYKRQEERLAKLRLWSLEDRRIRSDLLEVYKMIHGLSSIKLETFFEVDYGHRTRGHDWKLKKTRSNTNLRLHFFSERVWKIQLCVHHQLTVSSHIFNECGVKVNLCLDDSSVYEVGTRMSLYMDAVQ